jgi:hypothetical protein
MNALAFLHDESKHHGAECAFCHELLSACESDCDEAARAAKERGLPSHAHGYPIVYAVREHTGFAYACAPCATLAKWRGHEVLEDAFFEGAFVACAWCDAIVGSAYGEAPP